MKNNCKNIDPDPNLQQQNSKKQKRLIMSRTLTNISIPVQLNVHGWTMTLACQSEKLESGDGRSYMQVTCLARWVGGQQSCLARYQMQRVSTRCSPRDACMVTLWSEASKLAPRRSSFFTASKILTQNSYSSTSLKFSPWQQKGSEMQVNPAWAQSLKLGEQISIDGPKADQYLS